MKLLVSIFFALCFISIIGCSSESKVTENEMRALKQGMDELKRNNLSQAFDIADKLIRLNPSHGTAYSVRACCLAKMGRYEEAVKDFSLAIKHKAVALDEVYLQRGVAFGGLRKYDDALKDFARSLEINPSYSLVYRNRAAMYIDIGDISKAERDIQKASELDPSEEVLEIIEMFKVMKQIHAKNPKQDMKSIRVEVVKLQPATPGLTEIVVKHDPWFTNKDGKNDIDSIQAAKFDANGDGNDDVVYISMGSTGSCGYSWHVILKHADGGYSTPTPYTECTGAKLLFSDERYNGFGLKIPYFAGNKMVYNKKLSSFEAQ